MSSVRVDGLVKSSIMPFSGIIMESNLQCSSSGIKRRVAFLLYEIFAECSILFKFKEGEDFNHRNILDISRIKI